jgi:hypothetical protein
MAHCLAVLISLAHNKQLNLRALSLSTEMNKTFLRARKHRPKTLRPCFQACTTHHKLSFYINSPGYQIFKRTTLQRPAPMEPHGIL